MWVGTFQLLGKEQRYGNTNIFPVDPQNTDNAKQRNRTQTMPASRKNTNGQHPTDKHVGAQSHITHTSFEY